MPKPLLIYFENLAFTASSLKLMDELFQVETFPEPALVDEAVLARAEATFAPKGFTYDGDFLSKAPRLKALGTPTTGEVHIDVEEAARRNVAVCSLKNERELLLSITPTAELTWGMVLCLLRKIPQAHRMVREGRWDGRSLGSNVPGMLRNLSLGVLGMGRLGSLVAGYGHAFGMRVVYFDPFIEKTEYERCTDIMHLAAESDVVSVHVHLTSETERFLNADFFSSMPRGGYFVNTARGEVVDEAALLEALRTGHLTGAAIETLTGEHLPEFEGTLAENPLQRYAEESDNLLLFPRYGGSTRDSWELTEQRVIESLHSACAEGRPS